MTQSWHSPTANERNVSKEAILRTLCGLEQGFGYNTSSLATILADSLTRFAVYGALRRMATTKPPYVSSSEGVSVDGRHVLIWRAEPRARAWLKWRDTGISATYEQSWRHQPPAPSLRQMKSSTTTTSIMTTPPKKKAAALPDGPLTPFGRSGARRRPGDIADA